MRPSFLVAIIVMFLCLLATWVWQFDLKHDLVAANLRATDTQLMVDHSVIRVRKLEEKLKRIMDRYESRVNELDEKTRSVLEARHTWMHDLIAWIREGIEDRFTHSMFSTWESRLFAKNPDLNRPRMVEVKKLKRKLPVVPSGGSKQERKMGLNIEQP